MGTDWVAVVIGIVAGMLTTLLGWYVPVKLLVPKLSWGGLPRELDPDGRERPILMIAAGPGE